MSEEAIRREVAAMRDAAARMSMRPEDPLAQLLDRLDRLANACADTSEALRTRGPLGPDAIRQIAEEAADAVDARVLELARIRQRRDVAVAAGALFGVALAFLGGGYWWGAAGATAAARATEARLAVFFRDDPDAARHWTDLAEWNDVDRALAQCGNGRAVTVQGGRKGCAVPLWVEPPPSMRNGG